MGAHGTLDLEHIVSVSQIVGDLDSGIKPCIILLIGLVLTTRSGITGMFTVTVHCTSWSLIMSIAGNLHNIVIKSLVGLVLTVGSQGNPDPPSSVVVASPSHLHPVSSLNWGTSLHATRSQSHRVQWCQQVDQGPHQRTKDNSSRYEQRKLRRAQLGGTTSFCK
eukprot:sb/3472617/